MQATKRTAGAVRPVIHAHQTVEFTEHGHVRAKIIPVRMSTKAERRGAWRAVREIGPMEPPPRK